MIKVRVRWCSWSLWKIVCYLVKITSCSYETCNTISESAYQRVGSTLYVGLQHAVPPTNTKFQPLLLPTQAGMPYTNTHKHRTSYFKSTLTFLGPAKRWKSISADRQNWECLRFIIMIIIIRECGSTLYVGLARTAPPTNTNFRLTFFTNTTSGGSL